MTKNINSIKQSSLKDFTSTSFDKGRGKLTQLSWFLIHSLIFQQSWIPFMKIKIILLRMFGAKIGKGLIIKPSVRIKFPWKLEIEDHVWLGEGCWIENLDHVKIGSNVCISQGALLLTGNHDYTISSFDYRNAPIILEDGVWIGAKSIVCPRVICKSHSILTVGSIATKDLEPYSIYQGNPAAKIRDRKIKE